MEYAINYKFRHNTFKQVVSGLWITFLVMMCMTNADGQPKNSEYSDIARQRLLIRITAHYIHTISQGQIDMDSSIRIPCKAYGLSPYLAYNEGYSDGKPTVGTRLLDSGKLKEARMLLRSLHNEARLRLLIALGNYFIYKPGTAKADLDEASKYVSEAIILSETSSINLKIECMAMRAQLLHQLGSEIESQKGLAALITFCDRSGDKRALAQTWLNAGEMLPYGNPARLADFEKALVIFKSQNAKEKEVETLSDINVEYFIAKRYDLAEQLMRDIVKLQTEINFHHQQYVYDALAYLSYEKGNLTDAFSYSDKSLASVRSRADSAFAVLFFTRRATLYTHLQKNESAIRWFDKALDNKTKETRLFWYKGFLGEAQTLNIMGRAKDAFALLRETGSQFPPVTDFEKMHFALLLGETYQGLHKFDLAENNYKIFLGMSDRFPVTYVFEEFPDAFFNISSFYRTIGKTSEARKLLDRGKVFTSKNDMIRTANYYEELFKIDSIEKRYLPAINDLHLSHVFSDSAASYEQLKKVNELLVKYEDEKKDKNIKLLNSQNQTERVRAEAANKTKNITLGGVVLLLIIIGLLFNRYLIKQRANGKLETNQRELDQKNFFLETLNTEQKKLLKEKEWLIKEVHHRVKNNLQMVTSLLYSQSVFLEDTAAKLAVKDSLRRMQAMALIHQKLYQDENISTIAMPEYLSDLVRYLSESFDDGNRIVFEQTIDPLNLDVSQAIPLGLIVTESIVNAIKYAFLNAHNGIVNISLQRDGTDHLKLKISDNGIGLPVGLEVMELNSLGLDLMQGLTKQLKGDFAIENDNGVHITVRFLFFTK